jgi:2-desacetyl-2-hydroxyethyl bacteriochlorophyllide A dehydrogenase
MKAAVFKIPQSFQIQDVPYPALEPDGVIIKVKNCGICGSDLHFYNLQKRDGAIIGHEFSGDVVDIGAKVTGVKKGDRVVAAGGRGCGKCYWCRNGQYIRCSQLGFVGYAMQGAFAEYCFVPAFKYGQYAAKFPESISYAEAATAEPLAVALYAVDQMQPKPDDVVAVIGLGIIGLFIIQILKSRGVKQIIVSGRRPSRLQIAKDSGATTIVDAATADITPVVAEVTSGKGADIVFECAGNGTTFNQALKIVHRGGKVNLVGLFEQPIEWNPGYIAMNDITLVGCGLRWDLPGAIELLKSGAAKASPMVTQRFPLEKLKEGFETQLKNKDAIKVMIDI